MNAIFQRRSVRNYTQEVVSDQLIKTLLEAGMSAPSAGNQKPWEFVVIQDKAALQRLSEASPYAKMIPDAAVAILICGDLEREFHQGFLVQDCSAATENILVEAADSGLGAVWIGIYPREERIAFLRDMLNIPEHIVPFALLSIGYPAETKDIPSRYDESRVHYEQW